MEELFGCPSKVKHPHVRSSNAWSQASREKSTRKYQNTISIHFAGTFSKDADFSRFFAHIVVNLILSSRCGKHHEVFRMFGVLCRHSLVLKCWERPQNKHSSSSLESLSHILHHWNLGAEPISNKTTCSKQRDFLKQSMCTLSCTQLLVNLRCHWNPKVGSEASEFTFSLCWTNFEVLSLSLFSMTAMTAIAFEKTEDCRPTGIQTGSSFGQDPRDGLIRKAHVFSICWVDTIFKGLSYVHEKKHQRAHAFLSRKCCKSSANFTNKTEK